MKNILSRFTVCCIAIAAVTAFGFLAVEALTAQKHSNVRVVQITFEKDIQVRPVLAKGGPGNSEMFSEMTSRLQPFAAINGTFYDENYRPLGDVLINGKLIVKGKYPNAIAVRKDGRVEFVRRKGQSFNWTNYRYALAGGPMLVKGGKVSLNPTADGFRARALDIVAFRSAVGLTKTGKLLLVTSTEPMKLAQMADAMVDLGANEAMNLDGGPACGLYINGKTLVDATLPMTNILVVYRK